MSLQTESKILFMVLQNIRACTEPERCVEALHVLEHSTNEGIAEKAKNLLVQIREGKVHA